MLQTLTMPSVLLAYSDGMRQGLQETYTEIVLLHDCVISLAEFY